VDLKVLHPTLPKDFFSVPFTVEAGSIQNGLPTAAAVGRQQTADFREVGHARDGAAGYLFPGFTEAHGAKDGANSTGASMIGDSKGKEAKEGEVEDFFFFFFYFYFYFYFLLLLFLLLHEVNSSPAKRGKKVQKKKPTIFYF